MKEERGASGGRGGTASNYILPGIINIIITIRKPQIISIMDRIWNMRMTLLCGSSGLHDRHNIWYECARNKGKYKYRYKIR